MITFIHAADLHLDTPFSGLEQISKKLANKLRDAPYESLAALVDQALEHQVDFVLIAGDIYNTKRVNIKAQSLFVDQMKRLEQANIAVFMIRGNHDFLTTEDKALKLPLPENVYTYSADVQTHVLKTKNNERVAISGFSYETQWGFDRKVTDYPTRRSDVNLHIGMLHGSLDGTEASYAPFSLQELRQKNYDYWALGHIHQRQELAPNIHYPGNIQGLHKNETGPKGALLVEWTPQAQEITFLPTAPIIWESLAVDITDVENVGELFETLRGEMETLGDTDEVLVHLTLRATVHENEQLLQLIQEPEFNEQLTKQLNLPNIWIASVTFLLEKEDDRQSLQGLYPEMWANAIDKAFEKEMLEEITAGIFNQIPSKYLNETNTKVYREELLAKAIAKIYMK